MADLHIQNQQQSSSSSMADHLDHHIHTQNTSVKRRRSRPSSSSDQRSSKKHSLDQEKLARNGFSAITLPISLCGNVLRGSVSDPSYTLQEQTMPVKGSSGLPPRPPISRCNSEVIDPATVKAAVSNCLKSEENSPISRCNSEVIDPATVKAAVSHCLKSEEKASPDSKEKEQDEEEEKEQEEEEYSLVAEEDKVPSQSQDEFGADYEEAISVEWVEKCLSLTFRCPCGKGYEVLISENNCYYKLV
ncbi:hypothetical protein TSUD_216790 [Trifolium subterraneum]|uniref:Uncharacterized protein n=1 Tax=Trifolium subterraneum TaxID=3900 RepID=A0A2Z6N964_TRISU|nr:hypothetical protein TSUD_216790 [Trifolium subterraneum]